MKKIIDNFVPIEGRHCVTTALRHLFIFNGWDISEDMLFGLGSGLGFAYFEVSGLPVVAGRSNVGAFEKALSENMGIPFKIRSTTSNKKALTDLKKSIDSDKPLAVYVDMFYLSYIKKTNHFGGHVIVVFGYDEEKDVFYVSDRDSVEKQIALNPEAIKSNYHIIPTKELVVARSSAFLPFPAKNKWIDAFLSAHSRTEITPLMIVKSIKYNLAAMTKQREKNIGLPAIKLFSEKILLWKNMPEEVLSAGALNCYTMINQIGGTGGGAFRSMYGNFLREAAEVLKSKQLAGCGANYLEVSEKWDKVAQDFLEIHQFPATGKIQEISRAVYRIFEKERKILASLEQLVQP
ncbi:MAG: BtrH N-terminal domain-containing protein [Ferruginibacter sp.]